MPSIMDSDILIRISEKSFAVVLSAGRRHVILTGLASTPGPTGAFPHRLETPC